MWSIWKQVSVDKKGISLAAFVGTLASISAIALMGVSAWLIASAAEMPPVLTLTVAAVSVRLFALSRAVLRYVERLLGHEAALKGLTNLRVRVYESLERITPIGISKFTRGEFFARMGADVDSALDLPLRVVLPWAQAVLVSVATVGFVTWVLPPLGAAFAIAAFVSLFVVPIVVRVIVSREDNALAPERARVTSAVVALTDQPTEILMTGSGQACLNTLGERDRTLNSVINRQALPLGFGSGITVIMQGVAVIAGLVIGIPAVTNGQMQPVLLAVIAFLPLALFEILSTLPATAVAWRNMSSVAHRLQDIESSAPDQRVELGQSQGVRLGGVTTGWSPEEPELHDLNINILPGDQVAVVGPSGSGKSTLAYLLSGYLAYSGNAEVNPSRAFLTQQSHIFDTTIRNNIQIGGGEMSVHALEQVLARASLSQWLAEQPEGLDTELGSFGSRISGGEAQRLAFARLLAARKELLILDEPTEHLDFETAEALEREIWGSTHGTTTIMITHRLTAAQECDQIIEIVDGRVTGVGNHTELLEAGGWYAHAWQQQSGELDMLARIAQLPVGVAVTQ